jgi:uncharacterized protein (TIGR02217 family)
MSHYFALAWHAGEGRFVVDPSLPVNGAAAAWHGDFFRRAWALGFSVIASQSFEILAEHMPVDWRQEAADGTPALTGWDPPSSLVSPANGVGMDYLQSVLLSFAGMEAAAGLPVAIQLGEPWWWIDPATGVPCFYDAAAKARYAAETGKAVPAAMTDIHEAVDAAQGEYLDWLGAVLGEATLALRDGVKAAHPGAEVTVLVYTPQIMVTGTDVPLRVNLPTLWAAPAFDVVQVEDYDHVIAGNWARHAADMAAMTARLGYPPEKTHYFSGFVLNEGEEALWAPVDEAIGDARARGDAEVFVWAYSQVVRDGFVYGEESGEGEVSGFHEVRFPEAISFGSSGGPRFSTLVVVAASGFEQRNANWAEGRASYNAGTGMTSEAALGELIAFFRARKGKAYGFRFKDWSDYRSGADGVSPVDQVIGAGDGVTTDFPLVKTYLSGEEAHRRAIVKPVEGTVRVAVDAEERLTGWTLDGGIVRFEVPPQSGETVQAGFEFDVPARFDTDALAVSLETFRAGAVPDIPIVELRLA